MFFLPQENQQLKSAGCVWSRVHIHEIKMFSGGYDQLLSASRQGNRNYHIFVSQNKLWKKKVVKYLEVNWEKSNV